MKRLYIILAVLLCLSSCSKLNHDTQEYDYSQDYRQLMRHWVISISDSAKKTNPDFYIIPQNCSPLFTDTGYPDGKVMDEFLQCIDGTGQESLSFGYDAFNKPTDIETKQYITSMLNVGTENGLTVVSVNYCKGQQNISDAIQYDRQNGYISFVSDSIDLTEIPTDIINEDNRDILTLKDAQNWLFMLNPQKYDDIDEYIDTLCKTNYDVMVIDAFFYDDIWLTSEDLAKLKVKDNGGKRLVISYLSIAEAEDYRYYWQERWNESPPDWMLTENPNWRGNYPVEYWNDEWQNIIAFDEDSYLNKIVDIGFDGVYLDIVDGYETFEDLEQN